MDELYLAEKVKQNDMSQNDDDQNLEDEVTF